jgi:hypothetical protein
MAALGDTAGSGLLIRRSWVRVPAGTREGPAQCSGEGPSRFSAEVYRTRSLALEVRIEHVRARFMLDTLVCN